MASGHEIVAKLVRTLGLHVAALRLQVSARLLRGYSEGDQPIPPELLQQCADVLDELTGPAPLAGEKS